MEPFFDKLKTKFKQKDLLIQLIIVNVAVFLVLAIINLVSTLFKLPGIQLTEYIEVSSNIKILITHIWTIITYMFVHRDIWHLVFNMFMLYGFGRVFLSYFNPKNLVSLYILGGIAGAVFYVIMFNTVPYYIDMGYPYMIGASASVMAIIFASAFYKPNAEIQLFFLGRVKIVYVAVFIFILDFISLRSEHNAGGHVAHIGGAILGFIYAKQYLKGKDITKWINRIIDWVSNLTKPKSKKSNMKVKYQNKNADYEYNERKNNKIVEIDNILDKIKSSGYSSLTTEEKKQLFDASKK